MSANNCVCVVNFIEENTYKVVYCPCVDEINKSYIDELLIGDEIIYTSENEAVKAATNMIEDLETYGKFVEYGIIMYEYK